MKPELTSWPAFARGVPNTIEIRYRRAIRGKVHRAASDYRWIAASAGLDPAGLRWEESVSFGIEDEPRELFAWRPLGSGYAAVHAYPSRAVDAAGRPGGLEKHVLYVEPAGLPVAAAAFALLSRAPAANDSLWWDSHTLRQWTDPAFVLPVPESACAPLVLTAREMAALVERGLSELRAAFDARALESGYAQWHDGAVPAIFGGTTQPLPPLALAAMLLPLAPAELERFAIAGGSPSSHLRAGRTGAWTAIVGGQPALARARPSRRAAEIRRALFDPAAMPARPAEPAGDAGPTARHLLAFLASERRTIYGRTFPNGVFWHPAPPSGVAQLIASVWEFEDSIDLTEAGGSAYLDARREHLRAKADEARAWLYVFAPGPETVRALPPSPASRVPALWFARLLARDGWNALDRYSAADLAELAQHSLDPARREPEVAAWIANYLRSVPDARRDDLIRHGFPS